jgi:hypothetical protein
MKQISVLLLIFAFIATTTSLTSCTKDEASIGNCKIIVKMDGQLVSGAEVALSKTAADYNNDVYLKGPITTGTDGTANFGELAAGTYYIGAGATDGTNLWYDEYELTMGDSDLEITLTLTSKK